MESTKETKAISLLGSDRPPYRFGGTSVKAVKADDIDDTQSAINVRSVDPGSLHSYLLQEFQQLDLHCASISDDEADTDVDEPEFNPRLPGHLSLSMWSAGNSQSGPFALDSNGVGIENKTGDINLLSPRWRIYHLVAAVKRDPIPEGQVWVIVDLIQAARASQDLNILLQTLRGLGPLLFPFELVAQQVFEILEIPKSFSQFGWTTKAEPENPVMAGMMGAPQFSSTPLRLTSAKRSTTPRLPLDATTSTQDLTRPVLQWKPTNPNTNTTIANMSTGLGNVIPTQSLPSASASAPTLQLAMPLDHGDLGDLGPLRSSSVSASPTTGSKSKSDEPERSISQPSYPSGLVAKKAGDGEILVSLGSNNANADPPYLLESMPPVQKQSRSLKAKSGKHMHWTLSDTSAWIPFPVISHAEAGHIHIHRNKDADAVQVWMLGVDDGGEKKENWLDITEEYETCGTEDGQATIRHPVFLDLVLRRRPETNAPSFVKEKVKEKEKVGAKKDKDADPGPIRKSSRKGKAREFLNI